MKTATFLAMAFTTLASIPLLAQQVGTSAQQSTATTATARGTQVNDSTAAGASANASPAEIQENESASGSGKATYAAAGGGFGDQAASHAWEMSSITGELDGKLDSKTAKAGDRVVLKTTQKVQTSDGTVIPKGSRLIGHVTEVQAYSKEHGAATMGIAFDRLEMKGGQNEAIYTLIKGLTPSASAMAMGSMESDSSFGAPMGGGPAMGGEHVGGGLIGGAGGALNGAGSMAGGAAGGVMNRTDATASTIGDRTGAGAGLGGDTDSAVQTVGHGDLNLDTDAHAAAAARAVPHATRIPGVMLAGSKTSSGLLLGSRKNIELESGTQVQLGIVAQ